MLAIVTAVAGTTRPHATSLRNMTYLARHSLEASNRQAIGPNVHIG
ncbi:MAG: hypothetical protein ACREFN_07170 [Acetobacteraceae bacterium]